MGLRPFGGPKYQLSLENRRRLFEVHIGDTYGAFKADADIISGDNNVDREGNLLADRDMAKAFKGKVLFYPDLFKEMYDIDFDEIDQYASNAEMLQILNKHGTLSFDKEKRKSVSLACLYSLTSRARIFLENFVDEDGRFGGKEGVAYAICPLRGFFSKLCAIDLSNPGAGQSLASLVEYARNSSELAFLEKVCQTDPLKVQPVA